MIGVVKLPEAVAIVADSFWRAKSAAAALNIVFSDVPQGAVSSDKLAGQRQARLTGAGVPVAIEAGNAPAVLAAARKVITCDFSVPFLYHAPMEPMTCTAHVTDATCDTRCPNR